MTETDPAAERLIEQAKSAGALRGDELRSVQSRRETPPTHLGPAELAAAVKDKEDKPPLHPQVVHAINHVVRRQLFGALMRPTYRERALAGASLAVILRISG